MKLDDLYDLYGDALYRYLTLRLGSTQDAEDVLQETFVRLARYGARRRFIRDPKAFTFRCAHNEANRRDAPLRKKFLPKSGRIDEYSLMIEGKENDDVASKNPW